MLGIAWAVLASSDNHEFIPKEKAMKRSTIAIAVLATGLGAPPLLVTAQAPSKPPANSMGHDMSAMQEQMKKMQAQTDRIRQTKDPKERQKLMAEHMKTMQDTMKDMRGMGMGGGMGADQRMQMMENRMDMMQMMMEQMMQHDQMMQRSPAK